jgi:hypothetical protein
MFFNISLILFLSIHIMVSSSVGKNSLSSEIFHMFHENWTIENQQIVEELPSMSEIIQLAKNAATLLRSPPRIYATSGNSVSLWPDQPGAIETSYGTSGVQPPPGSTSFSYSSPITLRTIVEPVDVGNYSVTFQSIWVEAGVSRRHYWKFCVSVDRQTTPIGEDGDPLPPLRM